MGRVRQYFLYAACISLLGVLVQHIQCTEPRPQVLSAALRTAEALYRLPKHITPNDGELTLFADFSDVRGDHVVLYLINRTNRRIAFSAQGGDPYVKLEGLSESGQWQRAQSHVFSGCGNSYFASPALRPREFFRFLGYYPADGEPGTVRYRVFNENAFILTNQVLRSSHAFRLGGQDVEKMPLSLVSNTGLGRTRQSDIAEARYDRLAVRFGNFDVVREMALGLVKPSGRSGIPWSRFTAVTALQRFQDEHAASVLETLLGDKDRHIRQAAARGLGIIGPQCPVAEARFQELLVDEDVQLRVAAIGARSERPMSADTIHGLRRLLDETDANVRMVALGVLARACKEFPEAHLAILGHKNETDAKIRAVHKNIQETWCPPSVQASKSEH